MRPQLTDPAQPAIALVPQAERAIELAVASPRRAKELAEATLSDARSAHDAEAESIAERALGLIALELKDGEAAIGHLRRAVRLAAKAALGIRVAEARMSLGRALLYAGDSRGAFREIDRAAASLDDAAAARIQLQRAVILFHHHRLDEALEGYSRALPAFRRAGDQLWQGRALNNRALVYAHRGALSAAESDLMAAFDLYSALGLEVGLANVEHNLGWVAAKRGDVPAALHWYDRSQERRLANGIPLANALSDRCELLLSIRLVAEARAAAERALTELEAGRMASDAAESRLMLAEAALLDHDFETARSEAETAARSFVRQRRQRWAALARFTALRAAWLAEGASPERLGAARRAATSLARAGWTVAALDAQLLSARIALTLGQTQAARRTLAGVRVGPREPVDLRIRAKHAEALLAVADGDRRRAYTALRSGMRLLHEYRAALGATELRARVTGRAEDLARLGLRLALEDEDARRALTWSEEWRAGALQLRPVRPPDNAELADELAELRRVAAEAQDAALAGRDASGLRHRQAALEGSIRRRTRRAPGSRDAVARAHAPAELEPLLGDRALISYLQLDGALHAVSVVERRARLHSLGEAADASNELEALRFAMRLIARRTTALASKAAALEAARHSAGRLDELLLRPLRAEVDERPLVIVPTGTLHAMPWSILPSLGGRAVAVAPSAAAWAGAETRATRFRDRVTVAAGPGLPFADQEARAVADLYGATNHFVGPDATATAVLAALEGADIAHLAAHGHFRADNPLFSSLRLADGPLTVYDLESLDQAPALCVLSACDSGLSEVHPGDELMGLAATLLALGTATIVASVVPVPDDATGTLMEAFHRLLASGLGPAEALARAQAGTGDDEAEPLAARAGFVCFGAG
jgi:hypothetical protein